MIKRILEYKKQIAEINAGIAEEHRAAQSDQQTQIPDTFQTKPRRARASPRRSAIPSAGPEPQKARRKPTQYKLTAKGGYALATVIMVFAIAILLISGGTFSGENLRSLLLHAVDHVESVYVHLRSEPARDEEYIAYEPALYIPHIEQPPVIEPDEVSPVPEILIPPEQPVYAAEDTGRLIVVLRDYDTGDRLQGAIFAVYSSDGEFVTYLVTDDYGEAIADLLLGDYLLQENRAAENHKLSLGSLVLSILPGTNSINVESRATEHTSVSVEVDE